MQVEFLGHAGFCIRANGLEILIDPWLTPSTVEKPVLECFVPKHQTIDYLIPEPIRTREEFSPDVILTSHYHTHHFPKDDIEYWLTHSPKSILIIGPKISSKYEMEFMAEFNKKYPQHRYLTKMGASDEIINEVQIQSREHVNKGHLAFFVKFGQASFLHLADATISRQFADRRLDPLWFDFKKLKPTLFVLSVGAISTRRTTEEGNFISENSFLSPVEAANLVAHIKPKATSMMGVFNFSIFKNRTEYGFSATEVEAYFHWAIHHLEKEVRTISFQPGIKLEISDQSAEILHRIV